MLKGCELSKTIGKKENLIDFMRNLKFINPVIELALLHNFDFPYEIEIPLKN